METAPKLFSPFLPLQVLVIILGIWIGYQVYVLNDERLDTEAQIQQILPQANDSLAAKKRLLALAQEVAQLATKDVNAAQIVKEFDIRTQASGASAPAPSAK